MTGVACYYCGQITDERFSTKRVPVDRPAQTWDEVEICFLCDVMPSTKSDPSVDKERLIT